MAAEGVRGFYKGAVVVGTRIGLQSAISMFMMDFLTKFIASFQKLATQGQNNCNRSCPAPQHKQNFIALTCFIGATVGTWNNPRYFIIVWRTPPRACPEFGRTLCRTVLRGVHRRTVRHCGAC